MRPSASSASSSAPRCPRPCGAETKFSYRSSAHFTGRPSRSAASATTGVSTGSVPLEPNAPPMSGTRTRIDDSGAAEHLRELRAGTVRALRRGPHRQPLARHRDRPARLHRRRDQPRDHVVGADDVRRGGERAVDVTRALLPARQRLGRRARVRDGRQRLVVDLDALGGVLGQRARLADHGGDRLAGVAHLARGQQRVRLGRDGQTGRRVDLRRREPAQVGRGQQRPAHRADPGVGVRRAHEGHVRQPVDAHVIQELGASCQNPRVLEPADWLSDSHDGEVT